MATEYINENMRVISFSRMGITKYVLQKKRYLLGLIPYWDKASFTSFTYHSSRLSEKKDLIEYLINRYESDKRIEEIQQTDLLKD